MKINTDKSIEINRGDACTIILTNKTGNFNIDDVIKFSIVEKKNYENVVLQKTYTVTEETDKAYITLSSEDTKIVDIISKPVTFWYEIEYNGNQTIIGYDDLGAKEFILYPEAPNKEE